MDIANLVTYDKTFPVKLIHPATGEETGIVINIVSFDSERVVKAVKAVEAERWRVMFDNDDKKLSPDQVLDFMDKTEREQVIAAIDSWDFGGSSFGDLGVDPECNDANKRHVVEHPNARWIRNQISARGADLTNFFQESATNSRKPSKRK